VTEPSDLVAEQLLHTFDNIKNELALVRKDVDHESEITRMRLTTLESAAKDFETRLRSLQDSSTQFKTLAYLATGGGLLSVISLLRELLK
jgi:hypothetical protein